MATERIIVVVEDRGTRRVQKNIRDVGETAKRSSSNVALLAKSLGALAAVAGLRRAIGTLASFEQQLSTVKGITQATESQFAALRDTASDLGATTRFSATQAAEGLVFLARAGFSVDEQLASIGDTLLLAQAGALDLGSAADIASNVLRGFRLEADQAGRAVDVLAKAANSSNTNVLQLGDGLKLVSPIASGVGVSMEETVAAVGALSDAGLQATLAGTGLRRVISELESPTTKTKRILESMGVTTDQVRISQVGLTSALKTLADAGIDTGQALEVFGDRGGPAFEVLSSSIPRLEEFSEQLRNAEGSARALADEMDANLNGALLSVKSAFEAVVLAVGDAGATDALEGSMRGLATALRGVANNMDDVLRVLIPFGTTLAAIKLAPFVQNLIRSAQAAQALKAQVAAGNVVLLGSAQAERQKTLAVVQGIEADIAKTTSTIASVRAEAQRAVVVHGSTTAMFAQAAVEKQLIGLEATLTTQTTALAAAQGRLAVSTRAAAVESSFLRTQLVRLKGAAVGLYAVIAANPIAAAFIGLGAVVGLLIAFDDQIKVTTAGFSTLEDVFAETLVEVKSILQDIGLVFEETFGSIPAFLEPIIGDVDLTVGSILLSIADFADRFVGFFEGAVNAAIAAVTGLGPAIQDIAIGTVNDLVRNIEVAIRSVQAVVLGVVDSLGVVVQQVSLGITNLAESSRQAIAGNFDEARMFAEQGAFLIAGAAERGFKGFTSNVAAEFDRLDSDQLLNRLVNPSDGAAGELGQNIGDAFLEGFNRTNITDGVTDILARAEARALQRLRDAQPAVDDSTAVPGAAPSEGGSGFDDGLAKRQAALEQINSELAEQARLLGLGNRERQVAADLSGIVADLADDDIFLTAQETSLLEARLLNLQALQDQASLYDEIRGPQEQLIARQTALDELFRKGRISADEYAEGLRGIQRAALATDQTLAGGFERGLLRIEDTLINFSDQAEATLVNAFGSAEDALVDFVTTGKVDFSGFVDSILADLTRLLARQALTGLLGLGGGGAGGIAGLFGGLFGGARAEGGAVSPDQAYLVGEKGPELFNPGRAGTIIPNNMITGGSPAAPPQVNVSVVNVSNENEVSDALNDPAVQDKIVNIITKKRTTVRSGLRL